MLTKTERQILKLLDKGWKYRVKAEKAKPGSRRQTRLADKSEKYHELQRNLFLNYYGFWDLRKTPLAFRTQKERIELRYLSRLD